MSHFEVEFAYHFAFRSADALKLFNARLEAMKKDGSYQRIFEVYGAKP
ncbi:hypothetical protein [Aeromonas allosaccharophila]|uniref:Solute-binding protein family 3/N-terminal domain-containing protein n=1 Tax=Aeromonas allosaccharophila TaxID=656 RepID=A0AAX3NQB3_9GAMM|nr:hypothetical protein [Aeromonas allosaccharophila]WED76318.1 hypothetical protein PYU98_20945 [Aeromonas allosaccharophila]